MYNVLRKIVKVVAFWTPLKGVGKNSEDMSLQIYNFSTVQNTRTQHELHEGIHEEQRYLHYQLGCQKDITEGKNRCGERCLPHKLGMISEPDHSLLAYCLVCTYKGRQITEFILFLKKFSSFLR